MLEQMTLPGIDSAIFSPESASGVMRSDWLGGLTIERSGRDRVPVSHSPAQAKEKASTTSATCGPCGPTSSASAALQSFLESRLRAKTASLGSTLYTLTWKTRVTPSGRAIFALRASARRTSDSGCGSWPTPNAGPQNLTDATWEARREKLKAEKMNGNGFGLNLGQASTLAAWPTPLVSDATKGGSVSPRKVCMALPETAPLAGWVTTTTRDWKDSGADIKPRADGTERFDQLPRQANLAGWNTPAASDGNGGKRPHPDTTMTGQDRKSVV